MALEILTKKLGDVIVIGLVGNLDTNTASDAESNINAHLDSGVKKLIINLNDTKYVSSAGLRVFLATAKKLSTSGGSVKLCAPNEVVKEILDISGFSTIIDVKDTEEEALNNI